LSRIALPAESFKTSKPVFLGTALRDATCIAQLQEMNTRQNCSDVTVIPFNTSHWIPIEIPKEVNEALEKWLNEKVSV
jgi:pimeloyl-ACP methyl ester carboxylesterase